MEPAAAMRAPGRPGREELPGPWLGQPQLECFWSPVKEETGGLWDEYAGMADIITIPSVFRACSPIQVNL